MRTNAGQGQILYIPKIGQRANFQHPLMKGCVGWWPLTDGGGDIAKDLVGGNNGVQVGGVTRVDTELGRAASFDGVDNRFDLTTLGGYDAYTNATTISMWCYLRDDSLQQYWFSKHNSANSSVGLFAWTATNGDLELKLIDLDFSVNAVRKRFNGLATQILDRWTHIVFVSAGPDFTLASNLDVYVDGVLQTATDSGNGTGFTNGEESGGILSLGGRYYDNNRNIDADFQNVRVWSRALSDSEVLELYINPWSGLSMPSETRYFYFPPRPLSETIGTFKMRNLSFTPKSGGRTIIRKPS